ncbi:AAA-like domain-containing protein [Nostoc sp. NMS9]|uniref:AAA-like domain-containing protein n=1 Tax=Nostoc sp. NMS9 TaxID=2815393 RepID=UPI0025F3A75F|nr:AAA-like domain-containing protein [Nostoc sp. NMS9]
MSNFTLLLKALLYALNKIPVFTEFMPRFIRLHPDCVSKVQTLLLRNGFFSQADFAEHLVMSQSTVSKFLNGQKTQRDYFQRMCEGLGIDDWRSVADLPNFTQLEPDTPKVLLEPDIERRNPFPIAPPSSSPVLETPEGEVPLSSPFYIPRPPHEEHYFAEISKSTALIRIKAPRQMGKSSLVTRILDRAKYQGDQIVYLSLQQATQQAFTDSDSFLRWFCNSVALRAKHSINVSAYHNLVAMVGSNLGTQEYFETHLLPDLRQPLTLGLDEIDIVFKYAHIYGDFLGFLRSIHEAGKRSHILQNLRLVIAHSTEVYVVPIDLNQSPFNVGITIELPEFTHEQVQTLADRHYLSWTSVEVDRLMAIVGGHPFLLRLAMYRIANRDITFDELTQTAFTAKSIYTNYLRRLGQILTEQPELADAMKEVVTVDEPVSLKSEIQYKLEAIGLVKITSEGVICSCELYRQYFRNFWGV